MTCRIPFVSVLAIVALAAGSAVAGGPAPSPSKIDPAALAILKKVETTMSKLKTYQGESWTTYSTNKDRQVAGSMIRFSAARPNRMRVDAWQMTVPSAVLSRTSFANWKRKSAAPTTTFVSDGAFNWHQEGNQYLKTKSKQPQRLPMLDGFFTSATSQYALLTLHRQKGSLREIRRDGTEIVDGVLCDKVVAHITLPQTNYTDSETITWYIGIKDGLLHRTIDNPSRQMGAKKEELIVDAQLRHLVIDAPILDAGKRFAYVAPKGARLVDPQKERSAGRPALLAQGKRAPDFTATDKNGKRLRLSDFRGKVVVLDFWASWCGPCKASMPHNQQVIKKLRNANVPVVLLALDNSEERAPFLQWVNEHKELEALTFAHVDPRTLSVSRNLYNVSGIPTQYIIDARGIIRDSSVGFGGPTDTLEKSIRQALAAR